MLLLKKTKKSRKKHKHKTDRHLSNKQKERYRGRESERKEHLKCSIFDFPYPRGSITPLPTGKRVSLLLFVSVFLNDVEKYGKKKKQSTNKTQI